MSDIAIQADRLGKCYEIGELVTFKKGMRKITSKLGLGQRFKADLFWALKDVSFELKRGEVLGVIGRNGAGKSTLLKILSKITAPSVGRAEINGRVGSLLEVGTGFHPELTGRENVYLNGAVLGMKKREIDAKFDEIVAFAETEKFIDTPVKRYSSGMRVRLAFAVAAHLEPEILICDEVLAVGDFAFQKKCLGKMEDVANDGRTVLFVSHNMGSIRNLTQSAMYLKDGTCQEIGPTNIVVDKYLAGGLTNQPDRISAKAFRREINPDARARFLAVAPHGHGGHRVVAVGEPLSIDFELESYTNIENCSIGLSIDDGEGDTVCCILSPDSGTALSLREGRQTVSVNLQGLYLSPGTYTLTVGVNPQVKAKPWDVLIHVPAFVVENRGEQMLRYRADRPGTVLCPLASWAVNRSNLAESLSTGM